ncbi:unnamed protein product [Schistosoma turkestanicum]|nr:unnamed protein product [Schistosoma turkestanicum]
MVLWTKILGTRNLFPLALPCRCDANRAVLSRTKRRIYERSYPVNLIYPNGGSIRIKFHEPRMILQVSFLKISPQKASSCILSQTYVPIVG